MLTNQQTVIISDFMPAVLNLTRICDIFYNFLYMTFWLTHLKFSRFSLLFFSPISENFISLPLYFLICHYGSWNLRSFIHNSVGQCPLSKTHLMCTMFWESIKFSSQVTSCHYIDRCVLIFFPIWFNDRWTQNTFSTDLVC